MRIGIAGPIALPMLKGLFPGGPQFPEVYSFPLIASLAERIHARGHEIAIFALSREVSKTQIYVGERIKVYICPQRKARWQMLDFFRAERRGLAEAMQDARCDIVHAHWTYEFGAAAIESELPHVIMAHDDPFTVLRFARHPYWFERPLLAWGVLRKAKRVTAVSPYIADSLHRFLRPQGDAVIVCNGVGADVFAMGDKRRLASEPGRTVFASILNGWGNRKNGTALVRAFALLRQQLGDTVELWMFGHQHENGGPAETWAKKKSLDSGIRFIGWVEYRECLRALAEKVDVLVHPSLEESHGMAVTEAMALGLPVIGGEHSGAIPWTLGDGQAGMLVDVRSPRSIADGMRVMVEDTELRSRLARAGRELARSRFHIDTSVNCYEAVLARACKEQAS